MDNQEQQDNIEKMEAAVAVLRPIAKEGRAQRPMYAHEREALRVALSATSSLLEVIKETRQ